MEHLQELYVALLNRLKILLKTEEQPLTELRLDIEQLIQLLSKDLDIEYDQRALADPIQNKTTTDITNSFWDQDDE